MLNIMKHCKTSWTTTKTSWKRHETLKTLWNIMKQSLFDATISALDAETSALDMETSAFGAATSSIARRSFDATISALGAATSAIARSYLRYRGGVYADIGDCGVGITSQMFNRVTNHGDMSTFSKPAYCLLLKILVTHSYRFYAYWRSWWPILADFMLYAYQ